MGDFFKGLVFGTVIGVVAGVLLAPQSGEETRKEIKKFALETADEAELQYRKAKRLVRRKIRDIREAGESIDIDSYKKLVLKVVDQLKTDMEVSPATAKRIGEKLNEDWNELKSAIV